VQTLYTYYVVYSIINLSSQYIIFLRLLNYNEMAYPHAAAGL